MTTVWDIVNLRRPVLNYVCPGICETVFSGSSNPVIILSDPLIGKVTGLAIGGFGGFQLTWNAFPGALCYNVYFIGGDNIAVILAQCIEDTSFVLPPNGPGFIVVTPVTLEGEGPPSDPFPYPTGAGGGTAVVTAVASCSLTSRSSFPGVFTIAREPGDTIGNLFVTFTLTGTAVNGTDYDLIPLFVNIPDGFDSAEVEINPIDAALVSSKTVILTLSETGTYTNGVPSVASLEIRLPVLRIVSYGNIQSLLVPSAAMADSTFCEWDGTFNDTFLHPTGETSYYFRDLAGDRFFPDVSIQGKELYYVEVAGPYGGGSFYQWQIGILAALEGGGFQYIWSGGKVGGATAAGVYVQAGPVGSDPRPTLELELFP